MRSRLTVVLIAILAGTLLLPILPVQAQQTTLVAIGDDIRRANERRRA